MVLDFDATDDRVHGQQLGRFFHGYYNHYCFLPLYVFCGDRLLVSYLRPSKIDGARHAWAVLALLVKRLRRAWPKVRIVFRGDSGFCRWRLLAWCERNGVDYIVGIARNPRLNELAQPRLTEARHAYQRSQRKQRLFDDLAYAAQTWDRPRRVIVKAEHTSRGANPRYVVTNLTGAPQRLYDAVYCARGDMENRIKGAPGELAHVQPVRVRREEGASHPLPPRVMGRHSRGWGLSVDRGAGRRGYGAPKTVTNGMPRLSLRSKAISVPPRRRWGDGVPRCLRTQACSYARRRDLGGLRVIPLSWRDR